MFHACVASLISLFLLQESIREAVSLFFKATLCGRRTRMVVYFLKSMIPNILCYAAEINISYWDSKYTS